MLSPAEWDFPGSNETQFAHNAVGWKTDGLFFFKKVMLLIGGKIHKIRPLMIDFDD